MSVRPSRAELTRLDDRWVPRAARRLRDAVGQLRGNSPGLVRAVRAAVEDAPALVACIATLFAAAVLLAVFGTDNALRPASAPHPPPVPASTGHVLGPLPHTAVPDYLRDAGFQLRRFGEVSTGRPTYALVLFRNYATPPAAGRLLGNLPLTYVYLRSPSHLPTPVCAIPTRSRTGIAAALHTATGITHADAHDVAGQVRALRKRPAQDNTGTLDDQERFLRAYRVDAAHFARPDGCDCVFAALVRGTANTLLALGRRPDVRAVEPAPVGVGVSGLRIYPLQPQVRTTVQPDLLPCA